MHKEGGIVSPVMSNVVKDNLSGVEHFSVLQQNASWGGRVS